MLITTAPQTKGALKIGGRTIGATLCLANTMPELIVKAGAKQLKLEFTAERYAAHVAEGDVSNTLLAIPVLSEIPRHLSHNSVLVIDSTHSGTGRSQRAKDIYANILQPVFACLQVKHTYIKTESDSTIRELASTFAVKDAATIIFISGDTSITEFINALPPVTVATKLTIFAIPAGTGNSLALSLGYASVCDGVQRLLSTHSSTIPLNMYRVKFPTGTMSSVHEMLFLLVLSWGFHASLVADSDSPEMREKGLERFQIAARHNLKRPQQYAGKTILDGESINGPFAYWLVTLVQRFEPTFEILPRGRIEDSNLYLISFNSESSDDGKYIMDIMTQVYDKGSHISNPKVTYREVQKGQILKLELSPTKSTVPHRFCVDGTIVTVPCSQEYLALEISGIGNSLFAWQLYVIK